MLRLKRTNAEDKDFKRLVIDLDAELSIRDGDDHDFYHQFNGIENIKYVIVAYFNDDPVAIGSIKQYDSDSMEVKRMFVPKKYRGRGYAMSVLSELEKWAKELGFVRCILETGKQQPEAIQLYHKAKFKVIDNYGQYANMDNSVCFEKQL